MASVTAPQTPAGRRIMKYLKKLEERSSEKNQRIGRMSKHLESKDHTIRRLRGQRDILRRVAQAPVKELQENDDSGKEERAYAKVVQDTVDSEKGKKLLNSALRRIEKLEKRFDQACAELEDEENKNLYLQAQLQPMQEARAQDKEIGQAQDFMDEPRFTMSPVEDTYACAIARQNALAVQVRAKFGNDTVSKAAMQRIITRRESLPSEAEDRGRFHFLREVFGARAFTV